MTAEFTAFEDDGEIVVAQSPDGASVELNAAWIERDDGEAGWEPVVRALVAADEFGVEAGDGVVARSAAVDALADAGVVDGPERASALLDFLVVKGALARHGDGDGLVVLPADPDDWRDGRAHLNWAAATAAVREPMAAARDRVVAATDDLDPVADGTMPEPLDGAAGAADAVAGSLATTASRLHDVANALDAKEDAMRVKAETEAAFPADAAEMAEQLGEMAATLAENADEIEGDDGSADGAGSE